MSRKILVVDIDPSLHHSVDASLALKGWRVTHIRTSGDALECARGRRYDVVVAGQGDSGVEGIEVARGLAEIQPDARVILAGEPGAAHAIRALQECAYAYFHTPLPEAAFADMAQQALDSGPWREDIRVFSALPSWFECEVRCKLAAAERLTTFVREVEADLPGGACDDVAVVFRELLLNAVEHGCGSDPRKLVRLSLVRTRRAVVGRIQDPGPGFCMESLPHAAVSNPEESPTKHVEIRAEQGQRPGGFGILMARNLVDELAYNECGNEVVFVKYVG